MKFWAVTTGLQGTVMTLEHFQKPPEVIHIGRF